MDDYIARHRRLVWNLKRRRRNRGGINLVLRMDFDEVWHYLFGDYGPMLGDDAPRVGAPSWRTVAYWWSECYADANHMTPDELDTVKALAAREVAQLRRRDGTPLSPRSFMAVVVAHIDSAATAVANRGIRSFIDLMLCRERRHAAAAPPLSARAAARVAYADARAAADPLGWDAGGTSLCVAPRAQEGGSRRPRRAPPCKVRGRGRRPALDNAQGRWGRPGGKAGRLIRHAPAIFTARPAAIYAPTRHLPRRHKTRRSR